MKYAQNYLEKAGENYISWAIILIAVNLVSVHKKYPELDLICISTKNQPAQRTLKIYKLSSLRIPFKRYIEAHFIYFEFTTGISPLRASHWDELNYIW